MKKRFAFILAGILFLAISVLIPSCKEEIYTDEEALAAMKEGLKYKNDLQKELATLALTNELQVINLQSQLSIEEMLVSDSLQRVGAKTIASIQVYDITGNTADMSGFSVSVNQNGVLKTLTTPENGLVVFPDFVTGTASIVVTKTGFARASGLMNITNSNYMATAQQAILVPVFSTESATAKVGGTLTAQLDLTTAAKEALDGGVVSLNFNNINDMIPNPPPNGTWNPTFGLIGIVYDGGFMQSVKTGADGKYEFKVPKTKSQINYRLTVATIQKKQKLLFGDYPNKMDTMRLDSMLTFFGYERSTYNNVPAYDFVGYYYNYGSQATFPGVNLAIDAPTGANTPTAAATINWAHNDSTLVTWSFSKFNFGNGNSEFTNITQTPVFSYDPTDKSKVKIEVPASAVINIVNGKVISMNMTNGGTYKEYGRFWSPTYTVYPMQASGTTFKFLEQLAVDDDPKNGFVKGDTTYQTAIARVRPAVLNQGKVKIPFTTDPLVDASARKGVGYTAPPNAEVQFYINTPAAGAWTGDSIYTVTTDLKVRLNGSGVSIDTLYADGSGVLPKLKAADQIYVYTNPVISTYRRDGFLGLNYGSPYSVTATPSNTYKVQLLNGFKIADGGLGYKAAPKVRVENYARKQGTTGDYIWQTIAEAATTIDADGRIIAVADPVMTDNLNLQNYWNGTTYVLSNSHTVTVPADVAGKEQAYARAMVDMYGSITSVLLNNEDYSYSNNSYWWDNTTGYYFSGKGYLSPPSIKVTPVGIATPEKPAVLKAVVNSAGRISNIIIVDGGKGYTVKNDPKALIKPENLVYSILLNGSSDVVYDIDLGSGWHGKAVSIFD